jgi:hypothetical protein
MEDQSQKNLRRRKPFRLLSKMGKNEVAQFRVFLDSLQNPKPDQKLIEFFDHCSRIQLWERDIDKATFQKATGLELKDNAFDKLVSKLYNQLTVYAALVEFSETSSQHAQFSIRFYEKRGLEQEEIGKMVKESKRELSSAVKNEDYFRTMLELEIESAEHSKSRTQSPEERGLVGLHTCIDSYYFILKLRFLCASANEQRIFGNATTEGMNELGLDWLCIMYPVMPTLAKVYFHAFHILSGVDDEEHLEAFRAQMECWEAESIETNDGKFEELNGYLLNYYIRKMNFNEVEALPRVHQFYQEGLRKGWLLDAGKLSPEHFKNILKIQCRMNLVSEARTFFEQFKFQLTDNQGGAVLEFTDAVLVFNERKFKEVIFKLETLIGSKGSIKADQFYGLDLRCLLLKAYYEFLGKANAQEWDEVDDKLRGLLHAFPSYIARKNLPRTTQLRFDNFRNAMNRIYTIAFDTGEKQRVAKMKELLLDLRSSSNLPDKVWFIQKAMEAI